jgi:predicted O-methyltransferase YrrM
MVPNAYRDRLEIRYGTAPDLLPNIIDNIDSVDMFYHESDITYESMMFECNEVKRKLAPGGLIVSDNISFNSSVWDFSGTSGVPAYNFKGAIGVAFF